MWRGGGPFHTDSAPRYNGEWIGTEAEMHHFAIDRHQKGLNAAFVDGSVRKMGVKELWQQKWHQQFDTDAAAKR